MLYPVISVSSLEASECSLFQNIPDAIPSMSKSIYKWTLQYSKLRECIIGISSAPFETSLPFDETDRIHNKSYCYFLSYDTKKSHSTDEEAVYPRTSRSDLGTSFIEVELDLVNKQFSIYVENKKIIIFDDVGTGKNVEYRLAVTILTKNFGLSLINFETWC